MASIKAWWFSFGAVTEAGFKELNSWIDFWHFRYEQWDPTSLRFPLLHRMGHLG
jgi:hypothetical protein